jgi:alpha-1,3-rhamnosyltransferase
VTPLVSVIIPSYNHAAFIEATVKSVLAQTLEALELLVIDDGSRDDSPRLLAALHARLGDPRLQLVVRENRGLARTLNEGLALARGRYFAYLGSDDVWERDKLALQSAAVAEEGPNCGAAFSDCWIIDHAGGRLGRMGQQHPYRGGDIYRDLVFMRFHPPSPTNFFVTDKLRRAGGFDEALAIEDRDAWLRVARLYRVAFVPRPLASFRVHPTNTSTSHPDKMLACNQATFARAVEQDPALGPYARLLQARNRAGYAAHFYNSGRLPTALRESLLSLAQNPAEPLAWRLLVRSLFRANPIGARVHDWYRSARSAPAGEP